MGGGSTGGTARTGGGMVSGSFGPANRAVVQEEKITRALRKTKSWRCIEFSIPFYRFFIDNFEVFPNFDLGSLFLSITPLKYFQNFAF
jgi:hypothetical protein